MGKALIIKGADFSQVAVGQIDIIVGQPTIAITIAGQVTISSASGDDIYYTTDGSRPTSASTKYTSAFNVQPNTTVKAVCYNGSNYSDVVTKLYDGTLQSPNISITSKGVVTISATDGASIRYTTDGSTPTSSSGSVYSEPFTVGDGVVIKAIAYIVSGSNTIVSDVTSMTSVVPVWMYGKAFKQSGASFSIIDNQDAVISPKIYKDSDAAVNFYFKATLSPNQVGMFNASDQLIEIWNAQGNSPRIISASSMHQDTAYVRFCSLIGQEYAGTGVATTYGGKTVELYYDGSTE